MIAEPPPDNVRDPALLEELAIAACRAGAEHVIPALGSALAIETKSSPTDVVTETDLASERAILAFLKSSTLGASFLAEESGSSEQGEHQSRLQWVIDPLDGTINFLYGLSAVAVSVAAAVDGQVVAGAVLDTSNGQVFSASKGNGARCDGHTLHVSSCDDLAQAMLATGYSYDAERRARHGHLIAGLLSHVRDVRCFGSSALHLCWVAAGRIDAYLERDNKPWDWAAGSLIAEEAGAIIELPCAENADLVMAAGRTLFEPLRSLVVVGDHASRET